MLYDVFFCFSSLLLSFVEFLCSFPALSLLNVFPLSVLCCNFLMYPPLTLVHLTRPPVKTFSCSFKTHITTQRHKNTHIQTHMLAVMLHSHSLLLWQCCHSHLDVSLDELNKMAEHTTFLWYPLLLVELTVYPNVRLCASLFTFCTSCWKINVVTKLLLFEFKWKEINSHVRKWGVF